MYINIYATALRCVFSTLFAAAVVFINAARACSFSNKVRSMMDDCQKYSRRAVADILEARARELIGNEYKKHKKKQIYKKQKNYINK